MMFIDFPLVDANQPFWDKLTGWIWNQGLAISMFLCQLQDICQLDIFNICLYYLELRADPEVCPDCNCNIEDSLSSNMRREIPGNTAYTQCFLLSDSEFLGFRALGL